jgi:hypothetical protein
MDIPAEERAAALLKTLDVAPATRAARGRYRSSLPISPGVRYWVTSRPRLHQDFLGVQFYGEGAAEAAKRRERLTRAGFEPRSPQTGQLTFAKPAPFAPTGEIDAEAIRSIRRDLDAILQDRIADDEANKTGKTLTFRQFMLASPLADEELILPKRPADWRAVDL